MLTRITINCPACSAKLAAPVSAVGRTLLCPECRTAIPVPELPASDDSGLPKSGGEIDQTSDRQQDGPSLLQDSLSPRRTAFRRLAIGLSVPLILGVFFAGTYKFQEWKRSKTIETAFEARNFDQVLTLDPNHAEALMGRIYQRLKMPDTDVQGAVLDLQELQKTMPQHAIHREVLPAISIARAMEHAAAGRITSAIEELALAGSLGSPEQQLNRVKQRIATLLLEQTEKALAGKRYAQAISDCDRIRKLVGEHPTAIAFERNALYGLAEGVVTDEEIANTIQRIEALDRGLNPAESASTLQSLYFKRSKLTHTQGDLQGAIDHYTRSLVYGVDDSEALRWGVTLSQATIVGLEQDYSKLNLRRALQLIELLEEKFGNSASVVRLKISLADIMFLAGIAQGRDEALDYAVITLVQAQAIGFIVEIINGKADFRSRISAALVDRGFDRIQTDRIMEGGKDLEAALGILPEKKDELLARLNQLPAELREQFPASLRGLEADLPVDAVLDLIPAKAEAFSVVRNMQSFSNKVDAVFSAMLMDPPRLLDAACKEARIEDGLNREGSVGWVHIPINGHPDDTKGMLFYLPASDFVDMIRDIKTAEPEKGQSLIPVMMNRYRGQAVRMESHGILAFERDRELLSATIQEPLGIQGRLIPIERWGQDLDAYFVTTRLGILKGFRSIRIPFGDGFLKPLLQQVGDSTIHSEALSGKSRATIQNQLEQLAVGLAIQPDLGIAARSRIWLSPDSDLEKIFSENPGGRETALSQLPDEKFLIAVGGPVSAVQSGWITGLSELLSPGSKALDIRINRLQAAVLAPVPEFAPEDEAQNPALQPQSENPWLKLLNRTILVVTVEDSQVALAELKALFAADVGVVSAESGNVDHIPVLRIAQRLSLFGEEQNLTLCIATPNRESLVFAYGGDEQLKRALEPFRSPANLSKSRTIKAAVRMLPQSTSWLVAMDLRVLGKWSQKLSTPYSPFLSFILLLEDEKSLPLALGMSWQKSDLDVHVSLPVEILPLAGRVVRIFNLAP